MGFQSFMADPKAYLGHHRVEVRDAPASALASVAGAAAPLPNGKQAMAFTQSPNNFITMIHTVGMGHPVHSSNWTQFKAVTGISNRIYRVFQPLAANGDIGFRYLPFRANHCTSMILDPNATFFITGPLTGCTVGTIRYNGSPYVFHSNDNVGTGAAARATQRTSIQQSLPNPNIPMRAVRLCEYQTHYHGMGFVFGRLRGGNWKFYAHATDTNNNTRTVKWAEV